MEHAKLNPSSTSLVLYVSPKGDDSWNGTLPEINDSRTDGPFATLQRARDEVRRLRNSEGYKPGTANVLVRGGKYFLQETLVLGAGDSGSRNCSVTYQAYPGEVPILSGGSCVTGWRVYQDEILQADLPGSKGGRWKFRQLFHKGKRQMRARWPKLDPQEPLYSGWAFPEAIDEQQPFQAFRLPEGFLRHPWAKPAEADVQIFTGYNWLNETISVASLDADTRRIRLQRRVKDFDCLPWYMPVPLTTSSRFYIENVLEELTQPGEWCFDSEEGRLYFWPEGEFDPAQVVVPRLPCLVDLHNASWINLRGFQFTETLDGDNYHRDAVDGIGAMFNIPGLPYCGEAVHLRKAEYCRIEDCHFNAVGGNGVYLESHNLRNVICHNELSECGANGIVLAGDRFHHPFGNRIEDNFIHHSGVFNKYTAGVFMGVSDGNLVRHNQIEHVPHHAINLSENPIGRNILEYNRIRFADQEISDSGAVNCWMEKPIDPDAQRCGHIIRFNYIADTIGCEVSEGKVGQIGKHGAPATGIYLDNETSHCLVYGNVILRAGNYGIVVHMGKNNLIENNIILDCPTGILFQEVVARSLEYYRRFLGYMTGHLVLRNIICPREDSLTFLKLDGFTDHLLTESNYNLVWPPASGTEPIVDIEPWIEEKHRTLSLPDWQDLGYDEESLCADPRFVDPAQDDFRLQLDSPAFTLGFQPIPFEKIGIRGKNSDRFDDFIVR